MILSTTKVMSKHKVPGESNVQCLEGGSTFPAIGEPKKPRPGDKLYLAAGEPYEIAAFEDSSFLLTIIRSKASQQA